MVPVCSKWAGKRDHSFLCSLLVHLALHINYSKSDLCLTQTFCFLGGYLWILSICSVSLPPDKLADIQQLTLSFLQAQPVIFCQIISFLGKANVCANDHSQMQRLCHVIQSDRWTVYHSPTDLFSLCPLFLFSFMSTGTVISFATESSSLVISTS